MIHMNKFFIMVLLSVLVGACATNMPINVVNAKPQNCVYLKTVSIHQCSTGALANAETTDSTLEALKSEAIKAGGNTIECCGIEKEETIVSGENPDSDKINCVGVVQHFANVYKCKE